MQLLLKHARPSIKRQLMEGAYRLMPVRCVGIPKSDGSEGELGIPTVTERLIQQALLQVLQALIDPTFSEHSHGFRPGRLRKRVSDAGIMVALLVARNSRRWCNIRFALNNVLTIACFERL